MTLSDKLAPYSIILASKSPRRQQFLRDLSIPFHIRMKDVAEVYPPRLRGTEITDYLANLKATPFENELTDNDILITSDTVVWFENQALGKPKNPADAFVMLKKLSGKKHKVITSVSIKSKRFQKLINATTRVYFKKFTDDEINYYIEKYQPFDKAGSYGIQDWIGKIGIRKIKGSYCNVMGFPIDKLYEVLMNL